MKFLRIFLFASLALLITSDLLAQRVKGPGGERQNTKEIIYVDRIVEVPGETTIINNDVIINVSACIDMYRQQTITYCASYDSCRSTSSIEVMMAIDPMISVMCRGLGNDSKMAGIESGIAVHKRCLDAYGVYDLNKALCKFTVEARRRNKVLETATVWEGENKICGKELFPSAAKKRNALIAGIGLGSAALGAVGGGYLYQRIIAYSKNIKEVLRNQCGITDENAVDIIAKNIKNQTHKTATNLRNELSETGGLTPDKASDCIAYLNIDSITGQLKTSLAETKAIITTEGGRIYVDLEEEDLNNTVYFDIDKYEIKPEGEKILTEIATFMNQHECVTADIDAYTSTTASSDYNKTLSLNRAIAVKDNLLTKGVKEEKIISAEGHGEMGNIDNQEIAGHRIVHIELDPSQCIEKEIDAPYGDDAGNDIDIEKKAFMKKSDFVKGAVVGGVGTGLVGAGITALATKIKCYLSGSDNMLAKWKESFKILP